MWFWLENRRERWMERDRRWALAMHRGVERPDLLQLFVAVSRLSDGLIWLAVMLALPAVGGVVGLGHTGQMALVGAVNLAIYACLKYGIGRPRPCDDCPGIRACARALDRVSFPSGHTLHAVAFAVLLSHHYPGLAPPLWAFAALVAVSRVVLGLHYPSDVLVGALIGVVTANVALFWQ
jgi:undecaprenyl-diphosphatase